jgi:hypothetical protein
MKDTRIFVVSLVVRAKEKELEVGLEGSDALAGFVADAARCRSIQKRNVRKLNNECMIDFFRSVVNKILV